MLLPKCNMHGGGSPLKRVESALMRNVTSEKKTNQPKFSKRVR